MPTRARILATALAAVPPLLLGGTFVVRAGAPRGTTHTYYIAADELTWDYAPSGANAISGKPFDRFESSFMTPGPDRVGRVYKKALYREYTDSTFTTLEPRSAEWAHLGALGPLLRASVGDTIRVVFRNNGSHPYTLHPHGVFYDKRSEGAVYQDGTGAADKADDGVPPGGTHVYVWPVPERAGPAEHEGSSTIWMYHSHANEVKDVNAGLVGPLIITRRGAARPDGTPKDVDREIVAAFNEVDENASWFADENLQHYATDPARVPDADRTNFASLFYLSNLRETVNGFSFGHTPSMTMREGERVRWYLFATTNFEMHAPHWHGNTVVANHMRTDVVGLLPMGMLVADMVPDNPGRWLFHCHVGPHLDAGMQAVYLVQPAEVARTR